MVRSRVRPAFDLDDQLAFSPCSPASSNIPTPTLSAKVGAGSTLPSPATHDKDTRPRSSNYKPGPSHCSTPPLIYSYFSSDSEAGDEAIHRFASSSRLSTASDSSLGHLFDSDEDEPSCTRPDMRDLFVKGDRQTRVHGTVALVPMPSGSGTLREVRPTCSVCSKHVEHPMDSGCEEHSCAHRSCGDLPSGWYTPFCHAHECNERGCPLPRIPLRLYCITHSCSKRDCTMPREKGISPFCQAHACQLHGCQSRRVDWSYYCWEHRCRDLHCEKPVCKASILFCDLHLAEKHIDVETYGLSPDLRRLKVLHGSHDSDLHRKRSRLGHGMHAGD